MAGVPVIVTSEHGKNPWKRWVHRWVERNVISRIADMRVCVSEDILSIRQTVDGMPADKLTYIPNGMEVPVPLPRVDRRPVIIGTVGRLIEAKDYPTLIRAARMLRDNGNEFELYLIGDGPERPHLEREIAALGLESTVKMVGFQENVKEWLAAFDVFALSSVREGQPLALLEAMAHGLPVVATRVGGIPETVEDGREGLLVDPGSPSALAAAIQTLVRDFSRRSELGNNARQRVIQDFSITGCL